MCGICGYIQTSEPPSRDQIHAMMTPLRQRGPDEQGSYLDTHVALGHQRLRIIDLETGNQPLHNENGTVQVVFNGEIYNYRELRTDLQKKGHHFNTRTDGEILAHLYEERGTDLVDSLNGMFAFAIWDKKEERLFLARDRMGQKPLFWARLPQGGIAFASELKSLLQHRELDPQIDLNSLSRFLLHGYVPSPWSIFQDVFKLDRAECLIFKNNIIRKWHWWHPPEIMPHPLPTQSEAADILWGHLTRAVTRRMVSDVPLGVFLSGGIDSSILIACMTDQCEASQIKTFTIGFEDGNCDESSQARMVAEKLGTEHHETQLASQDMLNLLPKVLDYLDEPFGDASVLPTYLLSQFARQHVTVALGGDGGDELLAGYPTFTADRWINHLQKNHKWLLHLIRSLIKRLPVNHRHMSYSFLAHQIIRGLEVPRPLAHQIWMGALSPEEQGHLLSPEVQQTLNSFDLSHELQDRFSQCRGSDDLGRLLDFYAQTYLQEGVLAKVDRASMANSLEVRSPFLDTDVVEYLSSLPSQYKLSLFRSKRILKRAAKGRIPSPIIRRVKHGFGIPLAQWLAGPLEPMLRDLLSPDRLTNQGLFDSKVVTRLLNQHSQHQKNHGRALWNLLIFQSWYDRWKDSNSRQKTLDQKPAITTVSSTHKQSRASSSPIPA